MKQWARRTTRDLTLDEVADELDRKAARIGTEYEEHGDDSVLVSFSWLPGMAPTTPGGSESVKIQRIAGVLCLITERDEWMDGTPTEAQYRRHTQHLTAEVYAVLPKRPQVVA